MSAFLADGEFVDPQDPSTFERCRLHWDLMASDPHSGVLAWYGDCMALRKQEASLGNCQKDLVRAECDSLRGWLTMERGDPSGSRTLLLCNFSDAAQAIPVPFHEAAWHMRLWSGAARYGRPLTEPAALVAGGSSSSVEVAASGAALFISG